MPFENRKCLSKWRSNRLRAVSCSTTGSRGQLDHIDAIEAVELGDYSVYYITRGAVRGSCEHKHRTVEYAYHCQRHDIQSCQKDGKVSDRRIYALEDGKERELVEREIYELDYAKRLMLGKTVLKQEQRELKLSLERDGSG